MKKVILSLVITLITSFGILKGYTQRFIETIPGNKDGGLRIFNAYSSTEIPHNNGFTMDTVFGVKNLIRLKDSYFSYYSYRKLIGSSNEAINNNSSDMTIGVRGYAHNKHPNVTYATNIGILGESQGQGTKFGFYGIAVNYNNTVTGNTYGGYGRAVNYKSYTYNFGLFGFADGNGGYSYNYGVRGDANSTSSNSYSYGIYGSAINTAAPSSFTFAGYFDGNIHVNGTLTKSSGTFKIDHPLDPENKYLSHSFVESPDMMNIYNGNVTTDNIGLATVTLPTYFEALNIDFRYQLTVIGKFAQAIVKSEIEGNRFQIETDKPNTKVSWQVTGVRNDAYARKNRVIPETEKPTQEKGKYLNPDAFDKPKAMNIHFHEDPKEKKQ